MKTIKERAQSYTDKVGILGAYQGYIAGATEQRKIDIDKACKVYADLLSAQGYNPIDVNAEVVRMKKAMEG